MKPIDFRNATFEALQERLTGMRAEVFAAWQRHGPGTTAELAAKAAISILTFRPRTTELIEMGFVCLTDEQPVKGEGTYRARSLDEAALFIRRRAHEAAREGLQLGLAGLAAPVPRRRDRGAFSS